MKKTWKFFQNLGFRLFGLILATQSWVMSSSKGVQDSMVSESPSCEKDLAKFFKIWFKEFWQLSLATYSWVNWVAKIACFAKIGLKPRQFFKTFQFPSHHVLFSFSSPPLPLSKLPFSIPKPSFSSSIFTPNPRKGMGFHSFLLYFKFKVLFFMDLIFVLRYCDMVEEHGFFCCFLWNWCMCFVENDGIMLVLHVFITCSCIILCFVLWCAYYVVDKMSFYMFLCVFLDSVEYKI